MAITRETAGLEIELFCEPEDTSPRGYFASGDDAMDREDEQAILSRLERGDDWAWFCAHVRVTYNGESADDYLGGCSYASEKDFRADQYFTDMVDTCLAELNKRESDLIKGIASELTAINDFATECAREGESCADDEHVCSDPGIDVRLQLYTDGHWAIRFGDASYDTHHQGFWGASSVPGNGWTFDAEETARDLYDQAMDDKAQASEGGE